MDYDFAESGWEKAFADYLDSDSAKREQDRIDLFTDRAYDHNS